MGADVDDFAECLAHERQPADERADPAKTQQGRPRQPAGDGTSQVVDAFLRPAILAIEPDAEPSPRLDHAGDGVERLSTVRRMMKNPDAEDQIECSRAKGNLGQV